MEKAKEQRAEKRLRYRWHARFALNPKQKPLSGQMVDVSSKGMALLCHADKNCPQPDQFITTNFGIPYFDSGDSFDTVFFNRIGRVCRIDNLSSKVNRIAIQFAEPLFFKPGEQDISNSDAKQRLEAKAQLIVSAKEKTVAKTQVKVKADNITKSDTEENTRLYSETLARAEEKAKAETKARAKAEAKAKTESKLRAKAEKKADTEAEKRAKIEAELQEKAESYVEQLAKVKAEAAQEIAGIKAETDDTIAKIKAECIPKSHEKKSLTKKNTRDKEKKSGEGILMDKVDKFITDRNRIF
jgi:DNA polymerase III gamma/tau subunit